MVAVPVIVVVDRADLVATYLAPGTPCMRTELRLHSADYLHKLANKDWTLDNRPWHTNRRLGLLRPDLSYAVSAFFSDDGAFLYWYIDFIEPVRRTAIGFDFTDLFIDIVIDPDGSWRWKDEDEFAAAREIGLVSDDQAAKISTDSRTLIAQIESSDPWWAEWRNWAPDPSWPIPELPNGWDRV